VVYNVVGGPQELGDGFVEEVGVAVGHVEFDGDGATYLHPYFRRRLLSLYLDWFEGESVDHRTWLV
jgi:hypothetical protein